MKTLNCGLIIAAAFVSMIFVSCDSSGGKSFVADDEFSITSTVDPASTGTVECSPSGVYTAGTSVQISAVPATGYEFAGWEGDITGAVNPVTSVINSNIAIKAKFNRLLKNAWYKFTLNENGIVKNRNSIVYSDSGFERKMEIWDGTQWTTYLILKGIYSVSGDVITSTLQSIYYSADGTAFAWYYSGNAAYDSIRPHVWGFSDILKLKYVITGNDVSINEDSDNDGLYAGRADVSMTYSNEPENSALTGSGVFPSVQYAGFNMYNSNSAYIYLSLQTINRDPLSMITPTGQGTLTVEISGPNGEKFTTDNLVWNSTRTEWETSTSPYPIASAATGLWWISAINVEYKSGGVSKGLARYSAATPYVPYTITYTTDTGYSGTSVMPQNTVGQDYKWPSSGTIYHVELLANGSSTGEEDPRIRVYNQSDLVNWIAQNDDSSGSRFPEVALNLVSGQTYYIEVADAYYCGGAYSVYVGTTAYGSTVTDTIAADLYENDDTAASAKAISLGSLQHHSFSINDVDWIKITIP